MTAAERSALHVLARAQDPPMPAVPPGDDWAQAGPQLRGAVAGFSGPAAIVDETWTVLAGNTALAHWTGGWSEQAPAERAEHHLAAVPAAVGAAVARYP